ncbi:hypothetical protein [Paludibacterium paludis]|uniref:Uncharacterized protein n=1 Tax=Paludibacterium paludis TaxID=1225769 RepID=A0A918P5P3_9NEIS|nr:hypothetical protein [Paludibacterium paludis]GGY22520.1 hypothetical protein GCM10011289_27930 [Paludibacterium paludis]
MQSAQDVSLASWKEELSSLVASARTAEDLAALSAFENALSPYLDNPGALRTLLGKIQSPAIEPALEAIVAKSEFQSLAEVKAMLPSYIEVVAA